ncbi:UPF0637 protein YktB [Weizmannia acidilactici]|uniref:DUF1054 domain-containing protein n=1 Tax=Weizmannia acidilactici TaxID=2607726 RepID=UPI00124C147B|nr:DUF1054 domain-containing protein [Weizmannia acidilactici]GER68454.1 UPF0637 protein YktB [Weizmannia acidilactici]
MGITAFTEQDFDVFQIEGLEQRMEQLKSTVRPKLEALGKYFSPVLSVMTGEEMYYHVVKHARRTVNPPKDTWVAFASNKRGYKMLPHFQIGLSHDHLFILTAVINECPQKAAIGKKLEKKIDPILENIPGHYIWSDDHTKPDATRTDHMNKHDLEDLFRRMQMIKKSEMLCGRHIPREEAAKMGPDELVKTIEDVFVHVLPIYKMA